MKVDDSRNIDKDRAALTQYAPWWHWSLHIFSGGHSPHSSNDRIFFMNKRISGCFQAIGFYRKPKSFLNTRHDRHLQQGEKRFQALHCFFKRKFYERK